MDYRLEPPASNPIDDVWAMDWLRDAYHRKVVSKIIIQAWAIDEVEAGESTIKEIIDDLWEGYEKWCDEHYSREFYEEFQA